MTSNYGSFNLATSFPYAIFSAATTKIAFRTEFSYYEKQGIFRFLNTDSKRCKRCR